MNISSLYIKNIIFAICISKIRIKMTSASFMKQMPKTPYLSAFHAYRMIYWQLWRVMYRRKSPIVVDLPSMISHGLTGKSKNNPSRIYFPCCVTSGTVLLKWNIVHTNICQLRSSRTKRLIILFYDSTCCRILHLCTNITEQRQNFTQRWQRNRTLIVKRFITNSVVFLTVLMKNKNTSIFFTLNLKLFPLM